MFAYAIKIMKFFHFLYFLILEKENRRKLSNEENKKAPEIIPVPKKKFL
jgi:hypothetical protein